MGIVEDKKTMDEFAEACHKLIDDGDCEADCCGPIPMLRSFVAKNENMVAVDYTDTLPEHPKFMYPVTDDLKCIFLDGVTQLCSVYSERPDVCREFGDESHAEMCCPHLRADGTKRNRAERRRVKRAVAVGQDKLDSHLASQRDSLMAN